MNSILEEMNTLYSDLIADKQMIITTNGLPVIKGIRFQIHQLLDNIFSNSIKYRKPDKPVIITLQSELINGHSIANLGGDVSKNYIRISVSDNGIGFEQKYADKIFEIFQRLHGKDEYSGTGIGLAICKRIVQNHAGTIYAIGVPDEGTTIYICFPVE